MKFKEFWKENRKGFLISAVVVILGFPLINMFQHNKLPSFLTLLSAIPIIFITMFVLMCLVGLVMGMEDE